MGVRILFLGPLGDLAGETEREVEAPLDWAGLLEAVGPETERDDFAAEIIAWDARHPGACEGFELALAHQHVLGVQGRRRDLDEHLAFAQRGVQRVSPLQSFCGAKLVVEDGLQGWAPGVVVGSRSGVHG